jgi:class 3 adenylate cyclase
MSIRRTSPTGGDTILTWTSRGTVAVHQFRVSRSAEYEQVTVLFADVVHSMDVAATLSGKPTPMARAVR